MLSPLEKLGILADAAKYDASCAVGASAARGVIGRPVTIGHLRGQVLPLEDAAQLLVNVHPSYLLRLPDDAVRRTETERFIADPTQAREWLALVP